MSGVLAGGDLPAGRDATLAGCGCEGRSRSNSRCSTEARVRRSAMKREVRALMTPRGELRPLYLNTQGMRVGKSGRCCR